MGQAYLYTVKKGPKVNLSQSFLKHSSSKLDAKLKIDFERQWRESNPSNTIDSRKRLIDLFINRKIDQYYSKLSEGRQKDEQLRFFEVSDSDLNLDEVCLKIGFEQSSSDPAQNTIFDYQRESDELSLKEKERQAFLKWRKQADISALSDTYRGGLTLRIAKGYSRRLKALREAEEQRPYFLFLTGLNRTLATMKNNSPLEYDELMLSIKAYDTLTKDSKRRLAHMVYSLFDPSSELVSVCNRENVSPIESCIMFLDKYTAGRKKQK